MPRPQSKTVFLLGSYAPSLINFRGALISQMAARRHKVIAAAPAIDHDYSALQNNKSDMDSGNIARQIEALGAIPVDIPMSRTGTNPLNDLKLLRRLTAILRMHKPDVFIPYTAKPVIWGSLAAAKAGVPLIAPMITGLGFAFAQADTVKRRVLQRAIMALYRKAMAGTSRVFFQNSDDVATFRELNLLPDGLPITMVNGSGVDIEAFKPAPLPQQPNFLMIARLLKAKGVREYAAAAMAIKRNHDRARFALVGWIDEGPDAITKTDLEEWIAGGIDYRGALDDVRPALRDASIYVLPSYREGTPRSVLEAMAMGRPVITTDAPGCKETVQDGENGFLVPPRDAQELERAMVRFIEQPDLRRTMGERSRQIAEQKYDVRKVNSTILDALEL